LSYVRPTINGLAENDSTLKGAVYDQAA
jgi:hypothetical protein